MPEPSFIELGADGPRIGGTAWRVLAAEQAGEAGPGCLLPLQAALDLAQAGTLPAGAGVWLAPDDDPLRVAPLLERVAAVGVHFPRFTDGRGYSSATLVRTRLRWRGELHAFGDVLQDQLFYLRRVGFDSFALRADLDPAVALPALGVFTNSYQASVSTARPHFARLPTDPNT